MDYQIRKIEAEFRLASMRKALLAKSCNVETINRAWSIKKSLKEYQDDKRVKYRAGLQIHEWGVRLKWHWLIMLGAKIKAKGMEEYV